MRFSVLVAASCLVLVAGCALASSGPEAAARSVDEILENAKKGDEELPTREQLLGMLDSMSGLTDEDRENLRKELTRDIQGEQLPTGKGSLQMHQTLLLFSLLGLLSLIFLFFGYKLYKSLTDRERQRLEKKKLKEEKRRNKTK